ncbi:MAG: 50S ribosome-binding GTPase [Nocardiopsaceae bacterium]|nr:50S ribosome-binding GTPase [Nocardiopsaceae bacterium]
MEAQGIAARGRTPSGAGRPEATEAAGSAAGGVDATDEAIEVQARVDARRIEAALLNLRKRAIALPLVFDIPAAADAPGTAEIADERARLVSQIDDYLLPRVRQSAAPILVALVGSTGAGKSTLVNSIVGARVSLTGVHRPTTNSPVLACHPDDIGWFAENVFLPTLPRVRQRGLARPGQDGLLVLAPVEAMPKGIALLDTPDIDSVAESHRAFAYQFLDASDLWLFMTSASRYADAPVWEVLQHARDRGAALGLVLSRVPPAHQDELTAHFGAMLDANGIEPGRRFVIPETAIDGEALPDEVVAPVKEWLTGTARRADRRVAVLSQTMAGTLDTFRTRIPRLAAHADAQAALAAWLRREAESSYRAAGAEFDTATRGARLLGAEVAARWRDYADSGDLAADLRGKRPAARLGRRKGPSTMRVARYEAALRDALAGLTVAIADRAAERVARAWRTEPAGAELLTAAEKTQEQSRNTERIFASAFGPPSSGDPSGDSSGGASDGSPGGSSGGFPGGSPGGFPGSAGGSPGEEPEETAGDRFIRSGENMISRAGRAVGAWQDRLTRQVEAAGGTRTVQALSLAAFTALLADGAERDDDIVAAPPRLLASALGPEAVPGLLEAARADLTEHVRRLLDEELLRFTAILDAAGPVDPDASARLHEAGHTLEAAR